MKMELPSPVLHSLFALNDAGYEAYVVGGCVRDRLMGLKPTDWDITTSALPEQTAAVFAEYHTIDTGLKHGTLTVFVEDTPLEITTYRIDGNYTDGRHPDAVTFTRSLKEDLRRRDFTVNAMAYHPNDGLIDPFGGQNDLADQRIRCVGDPEQRFSEDALRLIRGLRFAATLGFTIEPATAAAIHRLAPSLRRVAIERVTVELSNLLCGRHASTVVQEYADVLAVILPVTVDVTAAADRLSLVEATPLLRFGALLYTCSPDNMALCARHLRFSNRITEALLSLVQCREIPLDPSAPHITSMLHRLGPQLLEALITLREAYDRTDYSAYRTEMHHLLGSGVCYELSALAVNGADLQAIGIQPGPEMGKTLNALLEAVMTGRCANTRTDLLNYVQKT